MYYNRNAQGKSLQAHFIMPFLTEKAQSAVATTQTGGYINPTKLESGGSVRFALLDDQPLEFFEVWGESGEGKLKPFRFADTPTEEDAEIEMGNEFTRRMNRDGTGVEPAKFGIAVPVFDHESQEVKILQATQKGIIKEFDKISFSICLLFKTDLDNLILKSDRDLNLPFLFLSSTNSFIESSPTPFNAAKP